MPENKSKYISERKLSEEMANKSAYYINVGQEFVSTTIDKIKLALIVYKSSISKKRRWEIFGSLWGTLTLTILTTDKYKDFLGLSGNTWQNTLVVAWVLSLVLTLWTGYSAWKERRIDEDKHFIETICKPSKKVSA